MTNKLPEVGKRYKPKNENLRNFYQYEYEVIAITSKRLVVKIIKARAEYLIDTVNNYDLDWIDKHLEEIPTPKEEPKEIRKSLISREVEEAKEGLKTQVHDIHEWRAKCTQRSKEHLEEAISDLTNIARRLTKALDSQEKAKGTEFDTFKEGQAVIGYYQKNINNQYFSPELVDYLDFLLSRVATLEKEGR